MKICAALTYVCMRGRDKQRLDSDRGSQGDSMDDSRSPTGMLRTNAFCQISLKILHANPPVGKIERLNNV